ncbi:MAG: response regulator [Chloroflexi bacterium]|nr:response regulator [Chloroflexota bacterium]MCC6895740.1 response regulator [Anaerolineae bacterium]
MAKILVVDDEQLTVEMLSTFLRLIGHEAIPALSARQTWDKLAYEEPDLVLLDIMLPDDNGLDICRKLRLNDATRTVPIIMISAHFPPMTAEATDAGANGYLMKPIKLDVLKNALADAGITSQ